MEFTVQKLCQDIWALDQNGVRAFLVVGPDRALLVDTCFGGDILGTCRTLTQLPITLVTTHSDGDHVGCDGQFPDQYMHSAEFSRYESRGKGPCHAKPLKEGDIFSLGRYRLEVIWIPGHTPGSIALLDREHRFLISGDTVQTGCIFMHGEGRDLRTFRDSIARLERMRQEGLFDTVLPSHGAASAPADILEDHLALAEGVLSGAAAPTGPAPDRFPASVKVYRQGRAQMFYARD